jgi:predicted kinase
MGAALLDLDSMTNPLVDVVARLTGASDYGDPQLAELTRDARYECLVRVASDCLQAGAPAILIAPFTTERQHSSAWDRLEAQLADAGGEVRLVWLRIEPDLLIERVVARGATRDEKKIGDPHRYLASLNLEPPSVPHIEVDGAMSARAQAERIVDALGTPLQ